MKNIELALNHISTAFKSQYISITVAHLGHIVVYYNDGTFTFIKAPSGETITDGHNFNSAIAVLNNIYNQESNTLV